MIVLLFDIDGTLVHTGGAGMAALRHAMQHEFGVAEPHQVNLSGRTDRGIARELFEVHGIEFSEQTWARFQRAYLQRLEHELPRKPGKILPGVTPLLEHLAQRPRVHLGLLTGNVRAGADLKLSHYRLRHFFAFGGFGDDHPDRDDVAAQALSASNAHLGHPIHQVWVIGDTPLDVRCARAIGAKALAVATGTHSHTELQQTAPDLLLENFEAADEFLTALAQSA